MLSHLPSDVVNPTDPRCSARARARGLDGIGDVLLMSVSRRKGVDIAGGPAH
jgi:hypothetical protein